MTELKVTSEVQALNLMNEAKAHNEAERQANDHYKVNARSYDGTSRMVYRDGKAFYEDKGSTSATIHAADPDHVIVDGVKTSRKVAEDAGWKYDEINMSIEVEGDTMSPEAVEVTDDSITFDTLNADQIADALPEIVSEEATDAIVENMLDGDSGDISGIAVTAFAKESGLSNELARESLTTLRDGLQNQANQEVIDAGVDDVAKFYGGIRSWVLLARPQMPEG